MTDNLATKICIASFYALSLAVFVSVSLLSVFHLLTVLMLIFIFLAKEIKFKLLPKSSWALIAFIFVQLISAAVNFSELQDIAHSIGVIKYPLIALIGVLIYQNQKLFENAVLKKHLKIAFNIFLGTIIVAFIYGLLKSYSALEYFRDDTAINTRLSGFTDIMRYGYGSAIILLVLAALAINLKNFTSINKKFLIITILIGFTGMFLSYTRGAMLGFLLGLPVLFFYFNKKLTIYLGIFVASIIALMIAASQMGGFGSSRFLISSKAAADTVRISQYLSAIHAFKERPILGYGPQQLKHHVKEIKEKYNLEHKEYIEHAHNVFLEIAANSGILGLLTFLLWLGLWLKEIFTEKNNFAKQMFLPVILFISVAGQFEMLMMAQTSTIIYFLYSISHHRMFKTV